MKVKVMVEKLLKQNQELEVVLGEDEWMEITHIQTDDNGGTQNPVVVIS